MREGTTGCTKKRPIVASFSVRLNEHCRGNVRCSMMTAIFSKFYLPCRRSSAACFCHREKGDPCYVIVRVYSL